LLTAVIAELNPLHSGHEFLMKSAKSSEGLIVILSSNFTQRGSPSITDKFTRAENAIMAGADLVVELPFLYACSAGNIFADGACQILAGLGCVSRIVFGVEDDNFDVERLADVMMTETFGEILRAEMKNGCSYAKACSISAEKILPGSGDFLSRPNNTLALSYVTSIKRGNYHIETRAVKRTGIFSSKTIRENIIGSLHLMPDYSRQSIIESQKNGRISSESKLWPLIQCVLNRSSPSELRDIYGVDEGIENLMLKKWRASSSFDDFIGKCVCSRYTRSHIRRLTIYILLGLKRDDAVKSAVPYARVLAFNERGREILRQCRKSSSIPIITSLKYAQGSTGKFFAQVEQRATQLHEITMNCPDMTRESHEVLKFPQKF